MITDTRDPVWVRWPVVGLAGLSGGWMVFDGTRALITGDYVRIDGELGPWTSLVERVGVDAEGTPVKITFVALGLAQLAAAAGYAARRPWGRTAVTGTAIASLWYLAVGTVCGLAQLALLGAGRRAASHDSRLELR